MSIRPEETQFSSGVEFPEQPDYASAPDRSPFLPLDDDHLAVPAADERGISADVEPDEAIVPTKPDKNRVETTTPVSPWDAIEANRSAETRKGYPVAKMSSTAITSTFASLDK